MINYNDLKTNLIINNVPSDELLMKMAKENKLEPNQIYQTPDNSSEVDFIGKGGSNIEINSTDPVVGAANFIKVNGLNYEIPEDLIFNLNISLRTITPTINSIITINDLSNDLHDSYFNKKPKIGDYVSRIICYVETDEVTETYLITGTIQSIGETVDLAPSGTMTPYELLVKSVQKIAYNGSGSNGGVGGSSSGCEWIDGKRTKITETTNHAKTEIDMSTFIEDYDENAQYELLISYMFNSTSYNALWLESDVVSKFELTDTGSGTGIDYIIGTTILPIKRYLAHIMYASPKTMVLELVAYRKVGSSQPSGTGSSSLPIGSIFTSALPQTDAGVHLLDGSIIALNGVYKDFVNLFKTLMNSGYNLTCEQKEYDDFVTLTGSCGKFVLDEVNNTLRLPKITTFIQGLTDLTNIGKTVEAGLPNITGVGYDATVNSTDSTKVEEVNNSADGAIYCDPITDSRYYFAYAAANVGSQYARLGFDASRSNEIYGNSETVQPPSIKYPYYIVLANTIKTNVEVNIDNVVNDLNNKQDKLIAGNGITIDENNVISSNSQNIYSTEEHIIGK